ncbi:MAG TPA: hypothetical protein DG048_02220 [Pseudoalteromonas sp.]|nr:hypothetical protein [Pseudoalteromonas sp.]
MTHKEDKRRYALEEEKNLWFPLYLLVHFSLCIFYKNIFEPLRTQRRFALHREIQMFTKSDKRRCALEEEKICGFLFVFSFNSLCEGFFERNKFHAYIKGT